MTIAAYKYADGRKVDGRRLVVDVEKGRTTKGWKPRRLGEWCGWGRGVAEVGGGGWGRGVAEVAGGWWGRGVAEVAGGWWGRGVAEVAGGGWGRGVAEVGGVGG